VISPTIYGVTTKRLNEQVKRNAERFPPGCTSAQARVNFA